MIGQQDLEKQNFQQQAQNIREKEIHSPTLNDIILPTELKSRLHDVILLPLKFPETFQHLTGTTTANGPMANGVLLFEDSGCGKTAIIQAWFQQYHHIY